MNRMSKYVTNRQRSVDSAASMAYQECQNIGYFLWKNIYAADFVARDPREWRY